MKKSRLRSFALLLAILVAPPQRATAEAELCNLAASRAALEIGIPVEILQAITLTETGRSRAGRLSAWPWTANDGARGYWFETRQDALTFAHGLIQQGQRSFDLGCFQINWRWHGAEFGSPNDLLDPLGSARYAARLLRHLYDELGSWSAAAGAYHSRTPSHAARYRARFDTILASLETEQTPALAATPPAFPFLQGNSRGPSLVPTHLPRGNGLLVRPTRAFIAGVAGS